MAWPLKPSTAKMAAANASGASPSNGPNCTTANQRRSLVCCHRTTLATPKASRGTCSRQNAGAAGPGPESDAQEGQVGDHCPCRRSCEVMVGGVLRDRRPERRKGQSIQSCCGKIQFPVWISSKSHRSGCGPKVTLNKIKRIPDIPRLEDEMLSN